MTLTDLLPRPLRRRSAQPPQIVEMVVTPVDTGVKVVSATPARKTLDPQIAAREATLTRAEAFRGTMFCPAYLRRF